MRDRSDARLLGTWITDPEDSVAIRKYGKASVVFRRDGTMTYTVHGESRDDVVLLTYRTEGDYILTDQPTEPHEERSRFFFSRDGKLTIQFGEATSRYIRA